jgi:hypothetical protein
LSQPLKWGTLPDLSQSDFKSGLRAEKDFGIAWHESFYAL